MQETLSYQRLGSLRIQKKVILNKDNPEYLEVAIGEIEVVERDNRDEIHYIISFGGNNKIRIIGKENWNAFLDMLKWIEWDPNDNQEVTIPKIDAFTDTYDRNLGTSDTLEFEYPEIDEEIIDGIPIYED